MNKETIDKKVKIELELFKIYSFFLIGLVTGIASILFRNAFYDNKIILIALIIGIVFLIFTGTVGIISYIKIYKFTKKL